MHAEAASRMHLSWCIPIWTHAASHTGPAQLSSLFTCYCHPVPGLNQLPACSISALTSAHWCLSLGCHLPGPCTTGRLDAGLPYLASHFLVTHVRKICHNLNFLRTETQVLGGYIAKPRQDSCWLQLCTLVSMAARPAGFPFPVSLWSRIPSSGTAWSSSEKMSSTLCVP